MQTQFLFFPSPGYVQKHWKDDVFFGHQCLNGVNPRLIERCLTLPCNLPVTNDMVFLRGGSCLTEEMQVFLTLLKTTINTSHTRSFSLLDSRQSVLWVVNATYEKRDKVDAEEGGRQIF